MLFQPHISVTNHEKCTFRKPILRFLGVPILGEWAKRGPFRVLEGGPKDQSQPATLYCSSPLLSQLQTRIDANQAAVPTWLASEGRLNGTESAWSCCQLLCTRERGLLCLHLRTSGVLGFVQIEAVAADPHRSWQISRYAMDVRIATS